jgi:hypothetical protein
MAGDKRTLKKHISILRKRLEGGVAVTQSATSMVRDTDLKKRRRSAFEHPDHKGNSIGKTFQTAL